MGLSWMLLFDASPFISAHSAASHERLLWPGHASVAPSPPRGGCSPCLPPANCNTPGNNRIPQSVTLLIKQPAPSTQQAGHQATDRPSTVLLMTLGFQEPAAALTPIRPGV